MRKVPYLRLTVLGFGLAITFSGCVVIREQTSQQLQTIGAVRLTTTACFSNQPGCPDKGNSGTNSGGGFQVLLAYRVPEAASAPQQITSSAGQALTFARDNSYSAELERLAPAGKGRRWLGYRSAHFVSISSPSFTVGPSFALKQAPNGAPFKGPFSYRVVTGSRETPQEDPNRPVDCGANLAGDTKTKTICVDSPSLAELGVDLLQPTQDLGILASGGPHSVDEGTNVRIPFRLLYAGKKKGAPPFNLRATTNVPGGSAGVGPGSFRPRGTSKVRVQLRVPHRTPNGSYDVSLTATLANGQVRSRTHELKVGPTKRHCGTAKPTIVGTGKGDTLSGTPRRDVILSLGGNDRVRSRGGDDLVCAGAGNDTVKGGSGNDRISGLAGRDMLIGGRGGDTLIGGAGKDRFRH